VHLQLRFIVANEVEIFLHGVQWPESLLKSQKQLHFHFFGMPLKMNGINVFVIFIFIQIDISAS
jgi:hypothetical protein